MKITRRQLRQIIKETIAERSDARKDADDLSYQTSYGGFMAGALGSMIAAVGLTAASVPSTLFGMVAAPLAALIGGGIIGTQTLDAVKESERKATAQRMSDILKRTMVMSLKRLKQKGLPADKVKKAQNVIMNGTAKQIQAAAKEGIIDIDFNDLDKVQRNMKSSASSELVDQEAIEKMIEELKDKLAQVAVG
jgi:hypothetical protein